MKKLFSQYTSIFLIAFFILLVVGFLVIKNNLTSPATVALISENPSTCQTNIDTFITAEGCDSNTFKVIDTKCKDGRSQKEGNGTSCIDIVGAYDRAQAFCGSTCLTSTPAPKQSLPPTPVPTPPLPSPRICAMEAGTCMSKSNSCLRYNDSCAKADFCATPYTPCPTPSIPPATPSPAPTLPPAACRAQVLTKYAYRELCPDLPGTETQYRYIDYTCGDETSPRTYGVTGYCTYGSSLKTSAEYFCRKNVCATPTPTPTPHVTAKPNPTITPTPTPVPGMNPTRIQKCYGLGWLKWCRNVVVN